MIRQKFAVVSLYYFPSFTTHETMMCLLIRDILHLIGESMFQQLEGFQIFLTSPGLLAELSLARVPSAFICFFTAREMQSQREVDEELTKLKALWAVGEHTWNPGFQRGKACLPQGPTRPLADSGFCLFVFCFKHFIYLIFRDRKGGRKRGRKTSICGCLS